MCVQFMLGAPKNKGLYYSGSIGHSHCSDASSILARSTKFDFAKKVAKCYNSNIRIFNFLNIFSMGLIFSLTAAVIDFIFLIILFKYFFKVQFSWLTLAGILLIGSLVAGFFDGPYWWIGELVYVGLVSFAFYKKFHLRPLQIVIAMIILLGVPLLLRV